MSNNVFFTVNQAVIVFLTYMKLIKFMFGCKQMWQNSNMWHISGRCHHAICPLVGFSVSGVTLVPWLSCNSYRLVNNSRIRQFKAVIHKAICMQPCHILIVQIQLFRCFTVSSLN